VTRILSEIVPSPFGRIRILLPVLRKELILVPRDRRTCDIDLLRVVLFVLGSIMMMQSSSSVGTSLGNFRIRGPTEILVEHPSERLPGAVHKPKALRSIRPALVVLTPVL